MGRKLFELLLSPIIYSLPCLRMSQLHLRALLLQPLSTLVRDKHTVINIPFFRDFGRIITAVREICNHVQAVPSPPYQLDQFLHQPNLATSPFNCHRRHATTQYSFHAIQI